jgi:putative flippase GtrA
VTELVVPAGPGRRFRVPDRFLRYAGVGVLSFVFDAGTLWLLYDVGHQNLVLATSAGFWLSFLVNFVANKYLTFSATTNGGRQLRRFSVVVAVSYVTNLGIVTGLVALGLPAVVSKLIAVGLLTVVNFAAYRLWVFAADPADQAGSGEISAASSSARAGNTQDR